MKYYLDPRPKMGWIDHLWALESESIHLFHVSSCSVFPAKMHQRIVRLVYVDLTLSLVCMDHLAFHHHLSCTKFYQIFALGASTCVTEQCSHLVNFAKSQSSFNTTLYKQSHSEETVGRPEDLWVSAFIWFCLVWWFVRFFFYVLIVLTYFSSFGGFKSTSKLLIFFCLYSIFKQGLVV